eukprot:scaffold26810_cov64-Phaeocystis_antarctica.AAC.3
MATKSAPTHLSTNASGKVPPTCMSVIARVLSPRAGSASTSSDKARPSGQSHPLSRSSLSPQEGARSDTSRRSKCVVSSLAPPRHTSSRTTPHRTPSSTAAPSAPSYR